MAAEPVSFLSLVSAGFAATLAWAGTLTKIVYTDKERIGVLEERTQTTNERLVSIETKLDRVTEFLIGKEE